MSIRNAGSWWMVYLSLRRCLVIREVRSQEGNAEEIRAAPLPGSTYFSEQDLKLLPPTQERGFYPSAAAGIEDRKLSFPVSAFIMRRCAQSQALIPAQPQDHVTWKSRKFYTWGPGSTGARIDSWNAAVRGAPERSASNKKTACGGSAQDAHLRSHKQDEFSWTSLISKLTKNGQPRQALRIYDEMREGGVKPSSYTFVAALKACSVLQDLESAKQVHAQVIENGFELDLYVSTMLVDIFGKCGSLVDAMSIFEQMPRRNVVSWNAIISAYAQREQGEKALQLYERMQKEGVAMDDRTFVGALKACCSLAAIEEGKDADGIPVKRHSLEQARAIHSQVLKSGSESVIVGNVLVDVYAKCGSLLDAKCIFEKMPRRDVISWTAMILGYAQMEEGQEAMQLYARMQQEGVAPDEKAFVGALKACSILAASDDRDRGCNGKRCLEQVRTIHADIVKREFESNVFIGTMLVDAYAKCRSLVDARRVFDTMPQRNVVSWNAIISGYADLGEEQEALELYFQMQQKGVVPDERTFLGLLKACSSLAVSEDGKQQCLEQIRAIHLQVVKAGCETDVFVGNMLVEVYAKCGSLLEARRVFDTMPQRNVVSWNTMILGYVQREEGEVAVQLYTMMQDAGFLPDDRTYVCVLKAYSHLATLEEWRECDGKRVKKNCLEQARAIHRSIVNRGCELATPVGNVLVDLYVKCGSLVDAKKCLEKMPRRDVVSWTSMILGYLHIEDGEAALQLYAGMQQEGVAPDARAFVAALNACASVAGLEKGKDIHLQVSKTGLDAADSFVASSLIDMYGKCGSLAAAQQVFDSLPTQDTVTWSALIAGYARQGESQSVFDLFQRMRLESIQPDGITFLSLLSVCSHVGLVDKGQDYFDAMSRDFGINPGIEHYTCMIDLLGRAGQLDQAMTLAKTMPFKPDNVVWETLLGACQKWNKVDLARQAFNCAVSLDKNNAAAYVLMTNVYAAAHMWEDAKEVHRMRVKTGAWKKAGQSWWTDTDGVMHAFIVGDDEHPETRHIYAELQHLSGKMDKEPYLPYRNSFLSCIST